MALPCSRWLCLLLLSLISVLGSAVSVASERAPAVLIVTTGLDGAYGELIGALQSGLTRQIAPDRIVTLALSELKDGPLPEAGFIVTVGTAAASNVASRGPTTPTLNTLLPRDSHVDLVRQHPGERLPSAIFMDQPVSRQLALIAEALPDWTRLAVIFGPGSRPLASEILNAAANLGYDVLASSVESDRAIYPALQRALVQPAVLIALPDREVYNSHTIQNVLLTSYRQKSPLIGFSPAYVRAGALLAVYSTPAQIGTEAAATALAVLSGEALPAPRYPVYFEVGANATVARSLGIRLEPVERIAERIRQREAGK